MEPQPKYREKVLIGLESAPPSFDVRSKVMGPGGANLQYITNETGAIVTIRGKGSGYIEPSNGHESLEPLHICVEHSKYEVLQAGRQLAFNLIETVQQEWSNIQQQQQQTTESQQQGSVQQHVQAISVHSQRSASTVPNGQSQESVLPTGGGALQLQLPIFTPPPSLAVPPPPMHLTQTQPIQVSVTNSSSGQSHQVATTTGGSQTAQDATSQQAIVQQTADIQHQIQIQPQQVYVSQGGGVIQPATIIPQQQIQQTSILAHQPQIITQSYPIQYVQASNGQMVVAYPNIVRPVAADTNSSQQPQVMLVQYAPQRPLVHGRTTTQSHSIPQIVQIVNPQTGQVQHVLQHIQPQIQMQQLALASAGQVSGGAVVGGQVLMPLQQSGQQQQILTAQQASQPIQFTTQHAQGMIIASQPHQVTVSQAQAASLQQSDRGSPQVLQQQQQQLRVGQGVKRRFESGPSQSNQLPPNFQNIPPSQNMHPAALTLQTIRKGIGSDGIQQQQNMRTSQQVQQQQQQQQQHIQQQILQQQQQVAAQQMLQHQQQIHVVQQSTIDDSQQIDEKVLQQQTLQTDDWRIQQSQQQRPQYVQLQTPNSPSNNDGNKIDQPKRGRPTQSTSGGDGQNESRAKAQIEMSKQQQASYAYQQQAQAAKQQQMQQFASSGGSADGYSTHNYQTQGYSSIYQQPPPTSFQQQPTAAYNAWHLPQP